MIPFDLAQFDDEANIGHTARSLELVGKTYIGKAGLERDSAALVLSRLYMRYVGFGEPVVRVNGSLFLGRMSNTCFRSSYVLSRHIFARKP